MNKEYWIDEGKSKMASLKHWIPNRLNQDDLLMDYLRKKNSEDINLALGDLSDAIKDRGIELWIQQLKNNGEIVIQDPEVFSEVVDHLMRNDYKYTLLNNKIELI